MDAGAAERQLNNIRSFILMEAKEKADEIRMKAKADADLEKQTTVLNMKTKLAEEYDRKEKQLNVDQRIKASMEERKQRTRMLVTRDAYLQKLNGEAKGRLATVADTNATAYTNLLKGLIKQAIRRLTAESKIEVRCRPQDLERVRQLTPGAVAELLAELKAEGEEREVTATVAADPALGTSAGGVIVCALDGKIKCNNTLEERLKLAMQDLQPVVRDLLFPSARAEPRAKPAINIHLHAPTSVAPPKPTPAPAARAPAPAPSAAGVGFATSFAPAPAPAAKPTAFPVAADPFAADPFAFGTPAPAPAAADPFAF